jgi:hypothetical protein
LTVEWAFIRKVFKKAFGIIAWPIGRSLTDKGSQPETSQPPRNMASHKKKAKAKTSVKFKDLASKKNPKGGDIVVWATGKHISKAF